MRYNDFELEEEEFEEDVLSLDAPARERDAYGNVVVPPDGSGYEDPEFDGTELIENLLGYSG